MRNIVTFIVLLVLFVSLTSAEIVLTQQPETIYNLGDVILIPAVIKSTTEISGTLQMNLICDGQEINFYKNGIYLSAGEEKEIDAALILGKEIIGEVKGTCAIKSLIGEDFTLTNEFKISDEIFLDVKTELTEIGPEETTTIEGEAIKANNDPANGFIDLIFPISNSTENITFSGTINNGFFSINFALPKKTKSGQYSLMLNAYEKDASGEITNKGFFDYNILIKQIPTNLEIIFENQEVEPGTNLNVKTILRDQIGEKIESSAIITIKNQYNEILEQVEMPTNKFLEFPINYNEPPERWTVVAVSGRITSELSFTINKKEDAKIELINKTMIVTNIGNVPYNKTLLVKIGDESIDVYIYLNIDESKRYLLTAPDGEYQIEIISNGESEMVKNTVLTGKVVNVKEISGGLSLVKYPLVWIFIIFILGFMAFMIFRKGYKKSFFGYIHSKGKEKKLIPVRKDSFLRTKNKAELSLSLKGEKQNSSVVCLKIKNLREIEKKEESTEKSLQDIIEMAEENKAFIYENQDYLFFILSPMITKTFKNERTAIKIAQEIEEILKKHNKMFKQKVEFGVSLNYGVIIAKKEEDILKFMSFGDLMATAKKIATISDKEVFLSEKIKEKIGSEVKMEKQHKKGLDVYRVKEIRHKEDHKKFISEFIKRIEGEKKKEE